MRYLKKEDLEELVRCPACETVIFPEPEDVRIRYGQKVLKNNWMAIKVAERRCQCPVCGYSVVIEQEELR